MELRAKAGSHDEEFGPLGPAVLLRGSRNRLATR